MKNKPEFKGISRLVGEGIKGRSFEHELAPLTVFVGDNLSGKTSEGIGAMQLLLLGYIPALGKTAAATWRLVGKEKGILKVEGDAPAGKIVREAKDGKEFVNTLPYRALNPQGSIVTPMLLDFNEYLNLKGKERVDFVSKQIDLVAAGYTDEELERDIDWSIMEKGIKSEMTVAIVAEIMKTAKARKVPVQEWLEQTAKDLETKRSNAAAEVKVHRGAATSATTQPLATTIPKDRSSELADLDERIRASIKSESEAASKLNLAEETEEKRADLNQKRAKCLDMTPLIESLEKQIETAKAAQLPDHTAEILKLSKEYEALKKKHEKYESATGAIETEIENLNDHKRELGQKLGEITRDEIKAKAEWAKKLAHSECPYCGSDEVGWKKKITKERDKNLQAFERSIDEINSTLKKLPLEIKALEKKLAESVKADQSHELSIQSTEAMRVRADGLRNEQANAFAENQESILKLQEQLAEARQTNTNRVKFETELAALPEKHEIFALESEREKHEQTVETLRKQKATVQSEIDQFHARQGELRARETAKQNLALAETKEACYKAAIKALNDLRQRYIDKAFGTFLEIANGFTQGFMETTPLEYREGEIGRRSFAEGTWISQSVFSESEQLLSYIGLSVALCQSSPLKIVLMTLGSVHPKNKHKVTNIMRAMIERGVIDQCILEDFEAAPYREVESQGGLKIIEVKP